MFFCFFLLVLCRIVSSCFFFSLGPNLERSFKESASNFSINGHFRLLTHFFLFLCFKSTVNICLSERPPQFAPWVIFHCRPPPNFSLHLQTLSNRSNHTALNHHLELRHQPSHRHAMSFKSRCRSNFVYQFTFSCVHTIR